MNKTRFAFGILPLAFLACSSSTKAPESPEKPATLTCAPPAASDRAVLLWSAPGFSAPESAIYDRTKKTLYVSNVAGVPNAKDGQGWISKLSLDGKMIDAKWATGLNAPKGLALRDGVLWTADIDEAVAIRTKTGKRVSTVKIPGAKFLNDVAAMAGEVFVSDMAADRIYEIRKSPEYALLREGTDLEGPNGLTGASGSLLVASWGPGMRPDFSTQAPGRILSLDLKSKTLTPWTKLPLGNLDGLEFDGPDAVFVSDWMAGKVYHVKKNGECRLLLEGFKGAADLTFIPETRTLVLPLMGEDRVVAYRIP